MAGGLWGIVVLLLLPTLTQAATLEFAPHKASYAMELLSSKPAAGISSISGTLDYSLNETCEAWALETVTDLTVQQADSEPVRTQWNFVSRESKDGRSFRFKVRNRRNGDVIDSYTGEAQSGKTGGQVTFHSEDGDKVVDLPAGTFFPTRHTHELLTKAVAGQRFWASPMFDGSSLEGAFQVTTALGARVPEGTRTPILRDKSTGASLLGTPSWPMSLAFFAANQAGDQSPDLPDFEIKLRYFQNGIASDIVQDFGTFSLKGTLVSLQMGVKPKCN